MRLQTLHTTCALNAVLASELVPTMQQDIALHLEDAVATYFG